MSESMPQLVKKIETYNFECEGGTLENCEEWQALKARFPRPSKLHMCECGCFPFDTDKACLQCGKEPEANDE